MLNADPSRGCHLKCHANREVLHQAREPRRRDRSLRASPARLLALHADVHVRRRSVPPSHPHDRSIAVQSRSSHHRVALLSTFFESRRMDVAGTAQPFARLWSLLDVSSRSSCSLPITLGRNVEHWVGSVAVPRRGSSIWAVQRPGRASSATSVDPTARKRQPQRSRRRQSPRRPPRRLVASDFPALVPPSVRPASRTARSVIRLGAPSAAARRLLRYTRMISVRRRRALHSVLSIAFCASSFSHQLGLPDMTKNFPRPITAYFGGRLDQLRRMI